LKDVKTKIESKAWDWSKVPKDDWMNPSDEFLPTALRWKQNGARRILDLGCGKGRHTLLLAEMGFHVTALDLSSEGITQLEECSFFYRSREEMTGCYAAFG
jgi:2-polyprenyl-3-methyl-5-hydroxy-6-metoxy-1,4-benzoquinol methylase